DGRQTGGDAQLRQALTYLPDRFGLAGKVKSEGAIDLQIDETGHQIVLPSLQMTHRFWLLPKMVDVTGLNRNSWLLVKNRRLINSFRVKREHKTLILLIDSHYTYFKGLTLNDKQGAMLFRKDANSHPNW